MTTRREFHKTAGLAAMAAVAAPAIARAQAAHVDIGAFTRGIAIDLHAG